MDTQTLLQALVLGVVEGLTEFIPVSSTGHIVLLGHFLGFDSPNHTFEIMIQLGAILAVLSIYARKLVTLLRAAPSDPKARRFIVAVLFAFIPSLVMGVILYDFIKTVLFETPMVIAVALIVGGVVLLVVDRLPLRPNKFDAMEYRWWTGLGIGLFQVAAMIPGVSRSGATIVGGMLLGGDKRSAAEFSFFLAMPTMLGAFVYDLYQNRDLIDFGAGLTIAIGFIAAFITALIVVRRVLDFVSRRGFAPFAWWRIGIGTVALVLLLVGN